MDEERISIPEEKFEDYTLTQLEVKKRITEEKIQEMMGFSIPYRIQKRFGINVYRLARYFLLIEIVVITIGFIYFYAPILMNPPSEGSLSNISGFSIFIFIMMISMIPTAMIIGSDTTAPLGRKLREIERAIRIKQEVEHGDKINLDEEESDTREYKSTFKYDINTKEPNPKLSKAVMKSIVGFLNSKGGHLVIGVSDDKKILGIENDLSLCKKGWDDFHLNIQNMIRDYTDIPISDFVEIKKVEQDNKQLCSIMIKPSPKPVYFVEGDKQDLFIRAGNRTIPLNSKQANEYINSHWSKI